MTQRSVRRPTVTTPVGWDEVEDAVGRADAGAPVFEMDDVLERVRERGDLFAPAPALGREPRLAPRA